MTESEKGFEKHFDEWIVVKTNLHFGSNNPKISEGQVWWCAVGENIGVEINGKGLVFSRPVVILKKLNSMSFMAIPLTSKRHTGSWYVKFMFKNKPEYAVLAQARVMSSSRLYDKMGSLSESDFLGIKEAFRKLYF